VDAISVVSAGPEAAKESLRKALAMGGDEAFHIIFDAAAALDHHSSVALMAEFFRKQKCDLILCGKQSQDTDLGLSAGLLASELDYPYVSNAVSIEINGSKALVKRQGDEGIELIELPMPCLISCSNDMNDPRVPTLKGIMGAKRKTINNIAPADLGMGTEDLAYGKKTLSRLLSMAEPPKRKSGTKFEGEAKELVSILVDKLQNEARAL
jgi:electron transfer flavoprotein beta subunit